MSSSYTFPGDNHLVKGNASPNRAPLFYSAAATLLLALMIIGLQQFYFHGKAHPGRELTPPIRSLIILYGIGMSGWVLLFLAQPLLILTENRRLYMLFGKIGACLAVVVVLFGFRLGIESTRVAPPTLMLWGLSPKQFMAVSLVSIVIFGVLVAIGVWNRRRPEVHRPMMLLSLLAVISAALDRIDAIKSLYAVTLWGTVFGPFFSSQMVGLILIVLNWALTRSLDRWLVTVYMGLVIVSAATIQLATTNAWDNFAGFLLR